MAEVVESTVEWHLGQVKDKLIAAKHRLSDTDYQKLLNQIESEIRKVR